ncbi:MAG: hypothetical protein EBR09_15635 [Proteobacteria bacterium]|nr:hypothetical protein [Pseudomonadota bacterium]
MVSATLQISGIITFWICTSMLGGCRSGQSSSQDSGVETVFFGEGKLKKTDISVCWEFASSETAAFREDVRLTVEKAFQQTKLRFSGWAECPVWGRGADFRIFIYDDAGSKTNSRFVGLQNNLRGGTQPRTGAGHPRVNLDPKNMNAWIFGRRAGIILSMTGEEAHPAFTDIYAKLSDNGKRSFICSASLHEFGHAIGMRHEDAHSDNKCTEFDESKSLRPNDVVIGPWNPTSFMERCFYRKFNYENGIVWPNELDISGINKRYP